MESKSRPSVSLRRLLDTKDSDLTSVFPRYKRAQLREAKKDAVAKKKSFVDIYIECVQRNKRRPAVFELEDAGLTRHQIRTFWDNVTAMDEYIRENFPDVYGQVTEDALHAPKFKAKLAEVVRRHNRFLITTAIVSCEVDRQFLSSLKLYCREHDAQILVLIASDPAQQSSPNGAGYLDVILQNDPDIHVVTHDTTLNDNFFLSEIKLTAKQIDPITGLGRLGQRDGSFVYGSPKQRLQFMPVPDARKPLAVMTSGAITIPSYVSKMYMSQRTAYLATEDHVMGALVVELEDDNRFHFRQLQADRHGGFVDLGRYYDGPNNLVEVMNPLAIVMGDYHVGETDPVAHAASLDMVNTLKPQQVIFHDLFNGTSVSHHDRKNKTRRAQQATVGQLSLEHELREVGAFLAEYLCYVDELVVVKSNHDEFLARYLSEGLYVDDPQNHRLALDLAAQAIDGNDPLRYGVERFTDYDHESVTWLRRDQSYTLAGVQCGAHGDKGPNGARGTLRGMEAAYGQSITGHSHTPGILRGAWSVGTNSYLDLSYNIGPSSWVHTNCVLYPNGSRQNLNNLDGRWRKANK